MVVLAARIFSPPGGFQDRDTAACCDYALRAGTALCHSDGRGFEPHRSPASTSTPPGTEAFFMAMEPTASPAPPRCKWEQEHPI